jgi:large subunit ribosomal protein L25
MAKNFTLQATARAEVGKGASRRLRRAKQVPAIIYGIGKQPQNIMLSHNLLTNALKDEAFYSHILVVEIDGKPERVVIKDMQRHPFNPQITHIDFQRISDTERLTMRIPLRFIGGDVAPGVKIDGGLVSHLLSEVEIRCLPKDLPEYIEVDISNLGLNQSLHLSDLKVAAGVELVDLAHGENKPVVNIHIPRVIVEEAPVAAAAEGEAAAGEAGAAGGEAGAAGAAEGEKGKPGEAAKGGAAAAADKGKGGEKAEKGGDKGKK